MGERAGDANERQVICLGEALVDLICPEAVGDPAEAANFEAHFGGALANVAVAASRAGGNSALAGGCGDDDWGRFLRGRLEREGVGLAFHTVVPGIATPFAFATLDDRREPQFRIHGDGIEEGIATLGGREAELAGAAAAVVIGSNTLVGERARGVTGAVATAARKAGVPVLFDPNLRPGRWSDLGAARDLCLELLAETTVLKCNLTEARWLLRGEDDRLDTRRAAEDLAGLGPSLVVVTAGTEPAIARGAVEAEISPPRVEMVSPLGAGDCFMGALVAGLGRGGWRLDEAAIALEEAARAGAEACTRLGAFD